MANPAARSDLARVHCGQDLLWNPWAPPVLLDPRAVAILDALDGSPLDELVQALAEVEQRSEHTVEAELTAVVRQLRWHGLLVDSPPWAQWSPAALNRPVTECDRLAWRLDEAEVLHLTIADRPITISIADPALADYVRSLALHPAAPAPDDLSRAAIELTVTPSVRDRGVHQLFGRAGRTYCRSTDYDEIVTSFFDHLAALEWMYSRPDLVWLDAFALRVPGGVAIVAGPARYEWARMARQLRAAQISVVEAPMVAIDPSTLRCVLPPPNERITEMARRYVETLTPAGPDQAPTRAGREMPLLDDPQQLDVVRVDHISAEPEVAQLIEAGHDPASLSGPVASHRLALLAHIAAHDIHRDGLTTAQVTEILETVVTVATASEVTSRVHHHASHLVDSLLGQARG